MFDQVVTALEQQEFAAAARLLKQWQQTSPQDPWLRLAIGRYQEEQRDFEKAATTYRYLLQKVNHAKVMAQARQGIQRVQDKLAQQREHALTQAQQEPGSSDPALLLLDPVAGEARQLAAAGLAKVMGMDLYTARMLLPSKQWRIYRVGQAGELQYFARSLRQAQTQAQTIRLSQVKDIAVFRVQSLQAVKPQGSVICENAAGQKGTISFLWQEVSQWVQGQLPLFESVVDLDAWGKLKRKEATQDYAEVIDLHLHGRNCILRFCDRTYQHRQSISFDDGGETTLRHHWNQLKTFVSRTLDGQCWSDFSSFGESSLEYLDLLPNFPSHINLPRAAPCPWDAAFHLYSSLCFLRYVRPSHD